MKALLLILFLCPLCIAEEPEAALLPDGLYEVTDIDIDGCPEIFFSKLPSNIDRASIQADSESISLDEMRKIESIIKKGEKAKVYIKFSKGSVVPLKRLADSMRATNVVVSVLVADGT